MTFWRLIATFFYVGKLPYAPGTWGSLAALLFWLLLPSSPIVQLFILIIFFWMGVYSSDKLSKDIQAHDPPEIVIDEVVGMGIALFMLPHNFILYLIAFILFRIFDILKPSFIYHLQDLPGGFGIMVDDIIAGIFTLVIITGFANIL